MKEKNAQREIIAAKYVELRPVLYGYICSQIGSPVEAEDMVQDVFVRLLSMDTIILQSTVRNFIFSIAHNLIVDYLRHHAHTQAASEYFFVHSNRTTNETIETIAAKDVIYIERACVRTMSQHAREIYLLSEHYGRKASDIAEIMGLSKRTVENNLLMARKAIRSALAKAV